MLGAKSFVDRKLSSCRAKLSALEVSCTMKCCCSLETYLQPIVSEVQFQFYIPNSAFILFFFLILSHQTEPCSLERLCVLEMAGGDVREFEAVLWLLPPLPSGGIKCHLAAQKSDKKSPAPYLNPHEVEVFLSYSLLLRSCWKSEAARSRAKLLQPFPRVPQTLTPLLWN